VYLFEEGADFVMMGKTGETSFLDKFIGSTAEYIIMNIKVPLHVVPEMAKSIIVERIQYAT
jgi:nucleotide-binding universal stress UspA family protein